MHIQNKFKTLSIIMLLSTLTKVNTMPVTVGTDPTCDYDILAGGTLNQALNHSGVTEIRIEKNTTHNPIFLDQSIIITGGYDNCMDAAANVDVSNTTEKSTLSGQNSQQVVRIHTNNGGENIELHNLILEHGHAGTLATQYGGGVDVTGAGQISLYIKNSEVRNNVAYNGGGIYFDGSGGFSILTLEDVDVHNNTAYNTQGSGFHGGGGVFISHGNMVIKGRSTIRDNTATSTGSASSIGGGIFMTTTNVHIIGDEDSGSSGIMNNTAKLRGGGLYLSGQVNLVLSGGVEEYNGESIGSNAYPIMITNNTALDDGAGAIYSYNSEVKIESVVFSQNSANTQGGAVLMSQSELNIGADPKVCWSVLGCNVFEQNVADEGGAIYTSGNSSELTVKHTRFHNNAADSGTTLYNLLSARVLMESLVIHEEGLTPNGKNNDSVIHTFGTLTQINYATIVENQTVDTIFYADSNIGNTVSSSIVYNTTPGTIGAVGSGAVSNQYSCVLANVIENGTINIGSFNYNNLFVNPAQFDFRLKFDAYAIDFCDGNMPAPTTLDLQGRLRGFDDPQSGDIFGLNDAGAYEYYDNDIIFFTSFKF